MDSTDPIGEFYEKLLANRSVLDRLLAAPTYSDSPAASRPVAPETLDAMPDAATQQQQTNAPQPAPMPKAKIRGKRGKIRM